MTKNTKIVKDVDTKHFEEGDTQTKPVVEHVVPNPDSKHLDEEETFEQKKKREDEAYEKEEKAKKQREEMLRQANELGINTEGLTDAELCFKVITEFNKANAQLATALATNETKGVREYAAGVSTQITDKDFLGRLMNLSVPNFYLHLFIDEDKKKTDKEIWKVINESKINPFTTAENMVMSAKKYQAVRRPK